MLAFRHLVPFVPMLALLVAPPAAASQRAACDSNIVRLASRSNGYQDRGTRCEGKYAQQVGGSTLVLVSFTEVFQPYSSTSLDTMRVEWPNSVRDSIQLRAEATRRGQYYRMDATQSARGIFSWPSRILASERIRGSDIGIIGWTSMMLNGARREILVPLRVRSGTQAPTTCGTYTVTLLPGQRLEEVFITLVPLDASGQPGARVRDRQPVNRRPYPPEIPVVIRIKRGEIQQAGIYQLRVDVRLSGGGTSSLEKLLLVGNWCRA